MAYDSGKGYGSSGGYGQGYGYIPPPPPLPLKRIKLEEIVNPCSGSYEGQEKGVEVEIMVDIDTTRKYAKVLNMVSGTISSKNPPWTVKANSLHFKVIGFNFQSDLKSKNVKNVTSDVKVVFSDGTKAGGTMELKLSLDSAAGTWRANLVLNITGQSKLSFKNIMRKSLFFKDIKLDVDFTTEELIWPTVEVTNLAKSDQPDGMETRKLDPFSAFEDAGIKLLFDKAHSQKVEDPSPYTPWTKSDLYEVMVEYFNGDESSDDNIWCMIGTTPPDKRYMGFSFDKNGHHGFGLFVGHKTFENLEHKDARKKAEAQRALLHYLVHECGHCLGLKHPFELGAPASLSWMNYAWKYDTRKNPGSFYRDFKLSFSDVELLILRHAPGKAFKEASSSDVMSEVMGSGYNVKTDVPDQNLADDDDDNDVESGDYGDTKAQSEKPRPMRKVALDLRVRNQYSKGQLLSFEARLKNQGKLPALIEGDLSIESGNLQVYITKPDGSFHPVEPFVRPIYTGYSRPKVLYTPEDEEGSDRYSQQVSVGAGSDGQVIDEAGPYKIRAVYNGGRYNVTSVSYSINVVDDTDEDQETSEEVLTAATLQSSSSKRFNKALEFWKKQSSQSIEKKKSKVATLVALFEGMGNQDGRYAGGSSRQTRRGPKKVAVVAAKPALSRQQLLKDTDDLVQYYREKGTKEDNFDYTRLVLARGKLYTEEKKTKNGGKEFDQLVLHIKDRGVKPDTVKQLTKKWKKITNPPKVEDRYTPENLQNKVNSVLRWAPTTYGNGERDLSGIGLGNPFSNFDPDNIEKAKRIIDILFNKYDETQDIYATVSYADKLQKGREVNNMVLRWALEAFIVHSMNAKKAGIKYPEPEDMDKSFQHDAAMVLTKREGIPVEQWMNYWRCDGDFNYHHRHFHVVYVLGRLRLGSEVAPHLERQGELFGYMHTQLLARYDAERESWGLEPVQPWQYDEKAASFNAGLEFHSDGQFRGFAPRPNTVWRNDDKSRFSGWESAYKAAVAKGKIGEIPLTPNVAGHILEPSSQKYNEFGTGGLHNYGHGIFASTGLPRSQTSYMSDTATAVRDIIFFRWHKYIDDLFQLANDTFETDITTEAPPVTITADDIILSTDPNPPAGFQSWKDGWTQKPPAGVTRIKTVLGPPTKKYEWDNKINHEQFYYHIRIKRNQTYEKKEALPLTVRIFICPKKRQTERTRWIEMDKFVCKIEANQDCIAVTRADVHSSVIKRNPKDMVNSFEKKFAETVEGFCECGWPYHMLLPRGKKGGEDYVLFVMATDNNVDTIGVTTSCGSMSYCGAKGKKYPDAQNMGYPFSNPIYIRGEKMTIPQAFDQISNAAYKTFTIENNVAEPPSMRGIDVWWPSVQLDVNDGTLRSPRGVGVTEVLKGKLIGNFRVLIDHDATGRPRAPNIMIRFQGRGPGGGSYDVRGLQIALRDGQTDKVKSTPTHMTYQKQDLFSVPETGLITDPVAFMVDPALGDYFVDFTLETPGVYFPAAQASRTSTFFQEAVTNRVAKYADIHCISGILSAAK